MEDVHYGGAPLRGLANYYRPAKKIRGNSGLETVYERSFMTKKELFGFYEKSYYHEIDIREKLNSRVQIPLAIVMALIGLIGYSISKIGSLKPDYLGIIFLVSTAIGIIAAGVAIVYFVISWRGHEYKFIPTSESTQTYLTKLDNVYSPYKNKDELVDRYLTEYLYNYYVECSTANAASNDKRSLYLHRNSKWLVIGFLATFLGLIPVQLSNNNVATFLSHATRIIFSDCERLYLNVAAKTSESQKESAPERHLAKPVPGTDK